MIIETKKIAGFEDAYTIDNIGRIFSVKRKRFISGKVSKNGYFSVVLKHNGQERIEYIHRLVALHFLKNETEKNQVNHIDGIKTNNIVSNLEWVTPSENVLHSYTIGREDSKFKYSKNQRELAISLRQQGFTFREIALATECSEAAAKRAVYANNKIQKLA